MKEPEKDEFLRLPGLYRSWELHRVVIAGRRFRIEVAGSDETGAPLIAVYSAPLAETPEAGE